MNDNKVLLFGKSIQLGCQILRNEAEKAKSALLFLGIVNVYSHQAGFS